MRKFLVAMVLAAGLAGCGDSSTPAPTGGGAGAGAAQAALPADLFTDKAPADAKSVLEAKKSAKAGEPITVKGVLIGRKNLFGGGMAMFVMADASLPSCANMPADACKTPWDSCCEDPKEIVQKTATVQVLDANGKLVKHSLQDQHGLKPFAEVTVTGTVGEFDEKANVLTINAKQIHVKGS